MLALVFVGFCSISFTSLGNSLLQLESDPQMRGRVMSFYTIALLGSAPVGSLLSGALAARVGVPANDLVERLQRAVGDVLVASDIGDLLVVAQRAQVIGVTDILMRRM